MHGRRPSKSHFGQLLVMAAAIAYLLYEVASGFGML
jgi:hypothetical protein